MLFACPICRSIWAEDLTIKHCVRELFLMGDLVLNEFSSVLFLVCCFLGLLPGIRMLSAGCRLCYLDLNYLQCKRCLITYCLFDFTRLERLSICCGFANLRNPHFNIPAVHYDQGCMWRGGLQRQYCVQALVQQSCYWQ